MSILKENVMEHTILIIILIFLVFAQVQAYEVVVKIKQGKITGTRLATIFERKHYYAFYGVPYAQPPLGKLRFQDPKPVKKWKNNFDATTQYNGACAQQHIVHKYALYGFENCLNMNIYTPQLPKNENDFLKSVVVWVHGFGFTASFSHIQGADFFIDNDVIFVSVTHRIGVFGFLKLDEPNSNGNMGLKDIVLALKWIKKNIKHFGGDLNNVTVMGNGSAAAMLSLLLMAKTKKLFAKMILHSGSIFSPSMLQGDPKFEIEKLKEHLKNNGARDYKTASTKDIIKATEKIYDFKQMINFQRPLVPYTPTIETRTKTSIVLQKPHDYFSNSRTIDRNIPIMIGFNSREGISESVPFLQNPKLLRIFNNFFKFMVPFSDGCRYNYSSTIYTEIADKIFAKYFKDKITEDSIEKFLKYTSDLNKYPVYKFIKTYLSMTEGLLYVYKFNYDGKFNTVKATSIAGANVRVKGASNGDEICYLMRCEPVLEGYIKISNNTNDRDRKFIKDITVMWANYAKYGDPTPSTYTGTTKWLPMTSTDDNVLLIGKENRLTDSRNEGNMYKFWNTIYDSYYTPGICDEKVHDEF